MGDRSSITLKTTIGDVGSGTPTPHGGDLDRQILGAAKTLVGRWGIAKTTVGDIAREAECSRASVYRAFPGGKQEVLMTLGREQFARFFALLGSSADQAGSLEDALVAVIVTANTEIRDNEPFQFLMDHEPGLVLPYLGFHRIDRLYDTIQKQLGPHFARFLGDDAGWAVEWAARATLSYVFQPSPTMDMSNPRAVHDFVANRMVPGLIGPDRRLATQPA